MARCSKGWLGGGIAPNGIHFDKVSGSRFFYNLGRVNQEKAEREVIVSFAHDNDVKE